MIAGWDSVCSNISREKLWESQGAWPVPHNSGAETAFPAPHNLELSRNINGKIKLSCRRGDKGYPWDA
eukprot:1160058-Pelagomonas_calceolata.AAC.17